MSHEQANNEVGPVRFSYKPFHFIKSHPLFREGVRSFKRPMPANAFVRFSQIVSLGLTTSTVGYSFLNSSVEKSPAYTLTDKQKYVDVFMDIIYGGELKKLRLDSIQKILNSPDCDYKEDLWYYGCILNPESANDLSESLKIPLDDDKKKFILKCKQLLPYVGLLNVNQRLTEEHCKNILEHNAVYLSIATKVENSRESFFIHFKSSETGLVKNLCIDWREFRGLEDQIYEELASVTGDREKANLSRSLSIRILDAVASYGGDVCTIEPIFQLDLVDFKTPESVHSILNKLINENAIFCFDVIQKSMKIPQNLLPEYIDQCELHGRVQFLQKIFTLFPEVMHSFYNHSCMSLVSHETPDLIEKLSREFALLGGVDSCGASFLLNVLSDRYRSIAQHEEENFTAFQLAEAVGSNMALFNFFDEDKKLVCIDAAAQINNTVLFNGGSSFKKFFIADRQLSDSDISLMKSDKAMFATFEEGHWIIHTGVNNQVSSFVVENAPELVSELSLVKPGLCDDILADLVRNYISNNCRVYSLFAEDLRFERFLSECVSESQQNKSISFKKQFMFYGDHYFGGQILFDRFGKASIFFIDSMSGVGCDLSLRASKFFKNNNIPFEIYASDNYQQYGHVGCSFFTLYFMSTLPIMDNLLMQSNYVSKSSDSLLYSYLNDHVVEEKDEVKNALSPLPLVLMTQSLRSEHRKSHSLSRQGLNFLISNHAPYAAEKSLPANIHGDTANDIIINNSRKTDGKLQNYFLNNFFRELTRDAIKAASHMSGQELKDEMTKREYKKKF